MSKYLVHYDSNKTEIQLRVQDSVALGFCHIKEAIQIDPTTVPSSLNYYRDEWLNWHNHWREYFIRKYKLDPNDVQ